MMNHSFNVLKVVTPFFISVLFTTACSPANSGDLETHQINAETLKPGRNILSSAAPSPAASKLEGLITGQLDNGMRYAIYPYNIPEGAVSIEMAIEAGSFDEGVGTSGIAHFLEHMAFNGSENIKEDELIKILGEKGLSIGASVNASTDYDVTRYSFNLPNSSEAFLDTAFFVLSEMAGKLVFKEEAIDRERGIIRSELRGLLGVGFEQLQAQEKFFYPDMLRTHRSPIGLTKDIDSVKAQDFEDFYTKYYRPEHTVLTIVGPVDPKQIKQKLNDKFSSWKSGDNVVPYPALGRVDPGRTGLVETFYNPEVMPSIILRWLNDTQSVNKPSLKDRLIDKFAENVFLYRYSDYISNLTAEDKDANITNIEYSYRQYVDQSFDELKLEIWPSNFKDGVGEAIETAITAKDFFSNYDISTEYLESLKQDFISWQQEDLDLLRAWESYDYVARLSNSLIYGEAPQSREAFKAEIANVVESITADDVMQAFKRHYPVDKDPLVFISLNEEIDDIDAISRQALKTAKSNTEDKVKRFGELAKPQNLAGVSNTAAQSFLYPPAETVAAPLQRDYVKSVDTHRFTFENNVKLNITTENYGNNAASININFGRGRFEPAYGNVNGLDTLLENRFINNGVIGHSANDLIGLFPKLDQLGSLTVKDDVFQLSADVKPEHLAQQIELLNAYFIAPNWDDNDLSTFQATYVEAGEANILSTLPEFIMDMKRREIICPKDILCKSPTPKDYSLLTTEMAQAAMARAISEGHIEISIVGASDVDNIVETLGKTFGQLPQREAKPIQLTRERQFGTGREAPYTFTHKGSEERTLISVIWPTPDGMDIQRSRQLNVLRDVFYGKVFRSLREAEGLTYSPGVDGNASQLYKNYGYVNVQADVKTQNTDKAMTAIFKIGEDMRKGNISAEEFQKSQSQFIETARTVNANREYMVNLLSTLQSSPQSVSDFENLVSDYENMTREDIMALSAKIFDREKSKTIHIVPQ